MITITENADIRQMTTFGLGAECGCLIEYTTPADLEKLYDEGYLGGEMLILGGGSNMLFVNGYYPHTVLHSKDDSIEWLNEYSDEPIMVCGAGVTLDEACRQACEKGLWGLENLSGIPGSTGGAAVQNAGAYGVETKDVLEYLEVFLNREGDGYVETMAPAECGYGYRSSVFKDPSVRGSRIIVKVAFRLRRNGAPVLNYKGLSDYLAEHYPSDAEYTPEDIRRAVLAVRDGKLPEPHDTGSAGSFFKNPVVSADAYGQICRKSGMEPSGHRQADGSVKLSAAWLIDKAGCKSLAVGGASLWPKQPLVLVNRGGATGEDVAALAGEIIARVESRFGVRLTPEVIFVS